MSVIYSIAESSWFTAFEDFMADYGMYIAAVGIGFLLCMLWWWRCHPEDFSSYEEDEEPEVWFDEIDHNDTFLERR